MPKLLFIEPPEVFVAMVEADSALGARIDPADPAKAGRPSGHQAIAP
jgi:hypothetical protein